MFRCVKHKLNDDMQVVLGGAELAVELVQHGEDARKLLRSITLAASKAIERIEQLTALNAVWYTRFQEVDLNALLCANVKALESALPPIVNLKFELEPLSTLVRADPDRLGLSLTHLVLSAAAYMPHGGEIVVSTLNGHQRGRDGVRPAIAQVLAIKAISTVSASPDIGSVNRVHRSTGMTDSGDDFDSALKVCEALVQRSARCDVHVSHTAIGTMFLTRFATHH